MDGNAVDIACICHAAAFTPQLSIYLDLRESVSHINIDVDVSAVIGGPALIEHALHYISGSTASILALFYGGVNKKPTDNHSDASSESSESIDSWENEIMNGRMSIIYFFRMMFR